MCTYVTILYLLVPTYIYSMSQSTDNNLYGCVYYDDVNSHFISHRHHSTRRRSKL